MRQFVAALILLAIGVGASAYLMVLSSTSSGSPAHSIIWQWYVLTTLLVVCVLLPWSVKSFQKMRAHTQQKEMDSQ